MMKRKITFAALIWAATFALSGCGDKPENVSESVVSVALPNTVDIFNIENQSDMAVTAILRCRRTDRCFYNARRYGA